MSDYCYNAILCRYSEIALKGANRSFFESMLGKNIQKNLQHVTSIVVIRERGRILLLPHRTTHFSPEEIEKIKEQLPKVFGLVSFSPGYRIESFLQEIEKVVYATFPIIYQRVSTAITDRQIHYRMRARRSHKDFPYNSLQIEIHFANQLLSQYPRLKVNLAKAELDIGLEIRKSWSFLSYESFPGPGGLPSGTNGAALSLLSGGIDSPVASYLTMKRGTPLHFLTFHSFPYTPPETLVNVRRLVGILNEHQKKGILFSCNFSHIQKIIRDNCTERYRTILYRRLMMRIATKIAQIWNIQALVTGDSIGQVASQTIANLYAISQVTDRLILRPLVGMDKQEIITIAKAIKTFPISSENCPDSCSVFSPKSPSTKASLGALRREESFLEMPKLIDMAFAHLTRVDLLTGKETVWKVTNL